MTEDFRWNVERPKGGFDDVGAHSMRIESATLIFFDSEGAIILAYAPGQWFTVTPEGMQ